MLPEMNSTAVSATGPKVVRITVTDADATDSSSDEDEPLFSKRPIVKKYINEVRLEPIFAKDNGNCNGVWKSSSTAAAADDKKRKTSGGAVAGKKTESDTTKKFRGVRQRPSGKWAAEIRVPIGRARLWLGTYDTAEEAAMVYDHAAIQLRGPNAITNFTTPPAKVSALPPESTSSGYNSGREPHNNLQI